MNRTELLHKLDKFLAVATSPLLLALLPPHDREIMNTVEELIRDIRAAAVSLESLD